MQLYDIGEFGLIEKIKSQLNANSSFLIKSIGDDAAVFDWPEKVLGVVTTDCLVENVHFDLSYTPFNDLGWKALAVNLSDVAAMAASPLYAVISLAINEKWSVENVQEFYVGLKECSEQYNCPIIGGDTATSPNVSFISITVIGNAPKNQIKYRSGAKSGDLIYITGSLGKSRTGFEVLSSNGPNDKYHASVQHFLKPIPKIKEIEKIGQAFKVSSLIDISDGLSSDIQHICKLSQVGCEIWTGQLPIDNDVYPWCDQFSLDPIEFALSSGEEYELLLTLPEEQAEAFNRFIIEQKLTCSLIGKIVPADSGKIFIRNNISYPLKSKGWTHF